MSNLFAIAIREVSPQVNKSRFLLDEKYRAEITSRIISRAVSLRNRLDVVNSLLRKFEKGERIADQAKWYYRRKEEIK